jgi:hypothetical protein
VDQESAEAIIRIISTEKRANQTVPDAESRDAGIRICKAALAEQKRAVAEIPDQEIALQLP